MPVLKGIKVDEFEDVTIIVFKDISTRYKKVDDAIHIVVSEADKSQSEEMVKTSETESICWSDTAHNIDVILDFPNKKSIEQFIEYLTMVKKEMYEEK
jgi:hypothetical protein